ncbi:MAG: AhpC/TSA family protein [Tannerellaceae bacterium]|jgi:thiol-disulfide isomerase/thioredoxin|nr:AhpC/TSA family protein [Tannerellaceae bacterium]
MKNCFYVVFAAALILQSCNSEPGFRISGTAGNPDLEGKYVYLYEYGSQTPRDSSLITNGAFTFKGAQDQPVIVTMRLEPGAIESKSSLYEGFHTYSLFFLLDNSKLKVALEELPAVGGSVENDDLNAYIRKLDALFAPHHNEITEMIASRDDKLVNMADEHIDELNAEALPLHKEYISTHNNSLVAAFVLYINRYTIPESVQRELIAGAGDAFKQASGIQKLSEHLDVLNKVAVGKQFTDFEMPDPKGASHKLSEYVGKNKLLMVDFWASWCGPCRRSMPYLKELYAKYNGKGFEILGVSFDRTHEAWVKGIADLELPWPQISDVQYWKCAAGVLYGVNSIPHTLLIDGSGVIVAKNLHGEDLDNRIAELLAP